jgi:secreted protein with Ig-like and vWFA domain
MYKRLVSFILVSASLAACGGGGAPQVDNSQAIKDAIGGITVPGGSTNTPAYTGATVAVDGVGIGYISGKDERSVVANAVAPIVASPSGANATLYNKLLSDAGLNVTVFGDIIGHSSITGAPLYAPDSFYVVKLAKDGTLGIVKK